MTVPMYIAECAPRHLRGRLVTLNNLFITGGQFIASAIDGAFSYDKENGWRYAWKRSRCIMVDVPSRETTYSL